MAGNGAFTHCTGYPITWAINSQNPYDFTNYAYVRDPDHKYVEDVHIEHDVNPSPPYGDEYIGIIGRVCKKDLDPVKSKCDDIDYVINVKDGGQGVFPFGCINEHGANKYGTCFPDNYHYIESRDWESVMNKYGGPIFCCSMPSQYTFDKDDPWMKDLSKKSGCLSGKNPIRTMKCPPTYWAGSPLCVPVLQDYCSTSENWYSKDFKDKEGNWHSYCDLYMEDGNGALLNNQRLVLVSGLEDWVTNKLNNGKNKPDPSKDKRVKIFTNYCSANVGVCDNLLEVACSNVKADDIKNNPDLAKMCGCFMPDTEYTLPGILPIECNGVCAVNSAIGGVSRGYFDEKDGVSKPLMCNQSTCIIDDVTIDLVNTELDGNVNFSQICGGCPSGNCTCVFNNITIDGANDVIKGNIDFTQECGGCSQTGITADGTPVSCTGQSYTNSSNNLQALPSFKNRKKNGGGSNTFMIVGAVMILIVLIFIVIVFTS